MIQTLESKFDFCINYKQNQTTYYCFYKILDLLTCEFIKDDPSICEDEAVDMATSFFWEVIEPKKNSFINFTYEVDQYYAILICHPDGLKEYHSSSIYDAKMLYHSIQAAQTNINYFKHEYHPDTIFEIIKIKEP